MSFLVLCRVCIIFVLPVALFYNQAGMLQVFSNQINLNMEKKNYGENSTVLKVEGALDGQQVRELEFAMNAEQIFTLDFDKVTDINFAAMRGLLRCHQSGKHFFVVNVGDAVAEKFEDTGVGYVVSFCRKPKKLDLSKYEGFGAGFLSSAYNSADGDSMLKVYNHRVPQRLVAQEKNVARAALLMGIPTPLVGTLYSDGEYTAVDFERIEGKVSFSRAITNNPERLEEIAIRFAKICKKLHATECNTTLFNDRTIYFRQAVVNDSVFNDEEKAKALAFLDSVPRATTCVHGDLQPGNVIMTPEGDMFIDMGDFGYGNPLLDIAMLYFQARVNSEEIIMHLFHIHKEQLERFWEIFVREYFDARIPEKVAEVDLMMRPYAALYMMYLGSTYGYEPHMSPFIRETLMK